MELSNKVLASEHEKLDRLIKLKFFSLFSDLSITSMQAMALDFIFIKFQQGEKVFPSDLEKLLFIRGSSVTSLLKSLEYSGYIQREAMEDDKRYIYILPTKKAEAIESIISDRFREYTDLLFKGFSQEEMRNFECLIKKMINNVK